MGRSRGANVHTFSSISNRPSWRNLNYMISRNPGMMAGLGAAAAAAAGGLIGKGAPKAIMGESVKVGATGNSQHVSVISKLKRRRRRRLRPPFSKRQKKFIVKATKKALVKLAHKKEMSFYQISNAANKVNWSNLFAKNRANMQGYFQTYAIQSVTPGTTTITRHDPKDLTLPTLTDGYNMKYFLVVTAKYVLRNNSTFPAKITMYNMVCQADTNDDPQTNLTDRIKYHKNTESGTAPSLSLVKEDDFNQYWTVPNAGKNNNAYWKPVDRKSIELGSGGEVTVYFKNKVNYRFITDQQLAFGPNDIYHLYRIMGVNTHTTTTNNLVMSETLVDVWQTVDFKIYRQTDSTTLTPLSHLATNGLGTAGIGIFADDDAAAPGDAV